MRAASTLAAAVMATGVALAAPAGFASADNGAQTTINYWEQQGYQVNIDRVGRARSTNASSRAFATRTRSPGWFASAARTTTHPATWSQ